MEGCDILLDVNQVFVRQGELPNGDFDCLTPTTVWCMLSVQALTMKDRFADAEMPVDATELIRDRCIAANQEILAMCHIIWLYGCLLSDQQSRPSPPTRSLR